MSVLSLDQTECLFRLVEQAAPSEVPTALGTCQSLLENVARDAAKYGTLKTSNGGLQKRLLRHAGGEPALVALGFVASDGLLTWQSSIPSSDTESRAAAVKVVADRFQAITSAVGTVGDSNAPSAAQDAVKLMGTYVGNIASEPDTPARRRIGAANKALNGRLLNITGGQALLAAAGFALETEQHPEAYVCNDPLPLVRLTLASLGKATAIWAELAALRGGSDSGDGSGSRGPMISSDAKAGPIDKIEIRVLPRREQALAHAAAADLQPALCISGDGQRVELHTYQSAAKTWVQPLSTPNPAPPPGTRHLPWHPRLPCNPADPLAHWPRARVGTRADAAGV